MREKMIKTMWNQRTATKVVTLTVKMKKERMGRNAKNQS